MKTPITNTNPAKNNTETYKEFLITIETSILLKNVPENVIEYMKTDYKNLDDITLFKVIQEIKRQDREWLDTQEKAEEKSVAIAKRLEAKIMEYEEMAKTKVIKKNEAKSQKSEEALLKKLEKSLS